MILYFASDLVWATRIKRTADDAGLACRPVRTIEMFQTRLDEGGLSGLIVDLDTEQAGVELVSHARTHCPGLRIVCFGPHVREDLFRAAAQAGADETLARGAFDRRLGDILMTFERDAGPT